MTVKYGEMINLVKKTISIDQTQIKIIAKKLITPTIL